jgi:hypothetical protein
MGKNAMNANVVNNVIMPKKENMARIPSLASGESMPIMADITEMTNTTITPTRANTPIMPDIANMARAPSVPKVGTIPDTENMSDTKNMPGDMPRMANTTNTPIMPDMANMVRLPRLEDVPAYPTTSHSLSANPHTTGTITGERNQINVEKKEHWPGGKGGVV